MITNKEKHGDRYTKPLKRPASGKPLRPYSAKPMTNATAGYLGNQHAKRYQRSPDLTDTDVKRNK